MDFDQIQSVGKCMYCTEVLDAKAMAKHIETHLKIMEKDDALLTKNIAYIHLKISLKYAPHFLNLLVGTNMKLDNLDFFLRAIWLECCGHSSGFTLPYKNGHWQDSNDLPFTKKIGDVFTQTNKLDYTYDFGSSTDLIITAGKTFNLKLQTDAKHDITILSRNEPLKIMCSICKDKVALCACEICGLNDDGFFCETCATEHEKSCEDFAEYCRLAVVNSPRMGVCGYEGGAIDEARDGVYKL